MANVKAKKPKGRLDSMLKLITLVLLVMLVVVFVKTRIGISQMQEKLDSVETQIQEQELVNKDMELTLRDKEGYMERSARENLGYANPEEEVYVDTSGAE